MANFLEVLGDHRSGDLIPELDNRLTEVLSAVRGTGKEGKLMLTLTIKPAGRLKVETVLIEDKVDTKIPELPKGGSIFFATDDNELHLRDPRQETLDLRDVNSERPPLRDVK